MGSLLRLPLILTACLSCGWVPGHPWRCAEYAAKTVRVFRVGKANTLLRTPNDGFTRSNEAHGKAIGLHRQAKTSLHAVSFK